ncbi:MAG: 6-carboxytetrahydropterin synthase [Armatimonadota bacterium]|nr:6-carboxytetrahydropterin synthase [Armatimonadota bacterium]MDR7448880.1 6-carboxytetrahydropterin synthase [Armatimonadota bacterium]MDR7460133.1 6-carboxytetrahydropterin synthase [Armatimonadota bacterium]MDR7479240.1 6-carboxytetrahydropterin synthase [Armatimonadota bacterium]MDR7487848.1 6-carboxytetrahydropterin synthase [Armatimonadota bacterium]
MFEVGVRARFEAAHRLRGDFGPATRLHGHTYVVEAVVRGPALSEGGTLIDVGTLRGLLNAAVGEFHYRDLDEVAAFQGQNTTAEVVARRIFAVLQAGLASVRGVDRLRVTVWESPDVFAAYEAAIRSNEG